VCVCARVRARDYRYDILIYNFIILAVNFYHYTILSNIYTRVNNACKYLIKYCVGDKKHDK